MEMKINLTEFRKSVHACEQREHLQPWFVETVLALIDTAEAAIAYNRTSWTHTDPPAKRRLRKTLEPYE